MRELILDVETTGLSHEEGDRIVEIAVVEMIDRCVSGDNFHSYLNPQRSMPSAAQAIHGLSGEFLEDKPLFSDIATKFIEYIADDPMVIHNAGFDIGFINAELSMLGLDRLPSSRAIDTLLLARRQFPGKSASLNSLCQRFRIDLSKRGKHSALIDCELLAKVYYHLVGEYQTGLAFNSKNNDHSKITQKNANPTVVKRTPREFSLITPEELAYHKSFVERLGAEAIWLNPKSLVNKS